MAKKFENLTRFDVWQLKQTLEIKNDGKASISALSKMIKLSEKLGEIDPKVNQFEKVVEHLDAEEKKKLTIEEARVMQREIWDKTAFKSMILEDDEFDEIKSCFKFCDEKELFPRDVEVAKRLVLLESKFELAKALDLNEEKKPSKKTVKKEA